MIEKCVAPSKLHLKKELIALQKARTLRDPETCSSLRSPFSFKSFAAYSLLHENETRDFSTRENISSRLLEIPDRNEKSRKNVYLYNWKSYSCKPSEGGIKLDEDGKQPSFESCHEEKVRSSHNEGILVDRHLFPAANICNCRDKDIGTITPRKSGIRLKRTAISNKRVRKHPAVLKQPEHPSSPIPVVSSVEQSDGTNSEDAPYLGLDLLCRASQHSPSASSQFSGSGCANWTRPSKIFRNTRDGSPHSCTPASTGSYYMRVGQKTSTAGSWCGTTAFEGDEFDQLDLPVHQGCGLPCYWSKRTKHRICRGCYSPSLCDTTEKLGGNIFCGSQKVYNAKRSIALCKPKSQPLSSRSSPLLGNNYVNTSNAEPLTNLSELDLEALSRLDGKRWSSYKSQAAFKVAGSQAITLDIADEKRLCIKYKPRFFDELIGQNVVVESLMNAVLRNKIAPAYLFHGPHGTGKTSAARIFSAAINCLATEGQKPCFLCKACTAFNGKSGSFVKEVSATDKMCIDNVRSFLKNVTAISRQMQYKIFIITECHLLTSKMWSVLLRFLEESYALVVFIFITVNHENLPGAILSRCQKYQFSRIKDSDVVHCLRKLSAAENLDIEIDALNLIAANSDGSLQDAETLLYQLSLLGEKITTTLVNDVLGVVSDEKLLDLLELAMSSKAEETVKMSRELMASGIDPVIIVSQLAGVMMDIIAGTYHLAHSTHDNVVLGGRSLTKDELKGLEKALKILSDTEKQFKESTDNSSLLTTALLHLVSGQNMETQLNTDAEKANQIMDNMKKSTFYNRAEKFLASQVSSSQLISSQKSENFTPSICHTSITVPRSRDSYSTVVHGSIQSTNRSPLQNAQLDYSATGSPWKLSEIWRSCIEKCYSKTLRQFLSYHGKLISVTEDEGILIVFIAFTDSSLKLRAERYMSSITNSLELVLKQNVEVRMGIVPGDWKNLDQPHGSLAIQHLENLDLLDNQRKILPDGTKGLHGDSFSFPRRSKDSSVGVGHITLEKYCIPLSQNDGFQLQSCSVSSDGNTVSSGRKENGKKIFFHKAHLPFSNEQILENSSWLQDAEKGASGLPNLSRTDTNLIIHQNSGSSQLYCELSMKNDRPSRHREDELNNEIKVLETDDILCHYKAQSGNDKNHRTISPGKQHSVNSRTNFDQQNLEYGSGPDCSSLFCWKTGKSCRRKVKKGPHPRSQKSSLMLSFRRQVKSKIGGSKSRR